ncbi:phosphotransferase [Prevotella sp.]|uniref:phosphotransferase n=1 Tax=Prevotella sp. TaxID=59823 RepID=UPI0025FFFD2A|nr:phosphotransferase [Prevotella sp.]
MNEKDLEFPYSKIKASDGNDTLMSFNMGSPGVEQKISILGYDKTLDIPFFAKFSEKPRAKKLTKNEIRIYRMLDGTGLTPKLLQAVDTDDYVYLKAEFIKGSRPKSRKMTDEVLQLCLPLSKYHLTDKNVDENGLKMSLSHGDFCPWNVLVSEGSIRLIDWELAADRTLGYDLFTYICQVAILFEPEKQLLLAIDDNMRFVKEYFYSFGITDYKPYLKAFAMQKWEYEEGKGNNQLSDKYKELANIL